MQHFYVWEKSRQNKGYWCLGWGLVALDTGTTAVAPGPAAPLMRAKRHGWVFFASLLLLMIERGKAILSMVRLFFLSKAICLPRVAICKLRQSSMRYSQRNKQYTSKTIFAQRGCASCLETRCTFFAVEVLAMCKRKEVVLIFAHMTPTATLRPRSVWC